MRQPTQNMFRPLPPSVVSSVFLLTKETMQKWPEW